MMWTDCSIFSVPQLGNFCLQVECMFAGQQGRWCPQSEDGTIQTEKSADIVSGAQEALVDGKMVLHCKGYLG